MEKANEAHRENPLFRIAKGAFVLTWIGLFVISGCRRLDYSFQEIEIEPTKPPKVIMEPTNESGEILTATMVPSPQPTILTGTPDQVTPETSKTEVIPTQESGQLEDPYQVVFGIIGDYGQAGPDLEATAKLVKSWNPDFIITTGDNNYPSGSLETIDENIGQYFHAYIGSYAGDYGIGAAENRFFPALGNHDWDTAGAAPYLQYFSLPGNERYYDYVKGPIHFFVLDSDSREPDGVGQSSVQAQWLKQSLKQSEATWKVVYMHHPPYSSAKYGGVDWIRWPFQAWGADVVVSGDAHVYERILMNDFPYLVSGSAGGPLYAFNSIYAPGSVVRYRDRHGALYAAANEKSLLFKYFNIDGDLIDEYLMVKDVEAEVQEKAFPESRQYSWTPVIGGLENPVLITNAADGSGNLYILEQAGRILTFTGGEVLPTPFLDIRNKVVKDGNEQGLLGLAFHPEFKKNGWFYVYYTGQDGEAVVSNFSVVGVDNLSADPNSELELLTIPQPFQNHNGGHLLFGPDGYLYIGLGDGGAAGDPYNNGQNKNTLLGSILRIDVDEHAGYRIPKDNPFSTGGGAPEIYILGVRNPWRFSFDREDGALYIGDVGQNEWEEIDYLPSGSGSGANLGWNYYEGDQVYRNDIFSGETEFIFPIWTYSHGSGNCSVTGGIVYRGIQLPEWDGIYLYGDFCSGKIGGLMRQPGGVWEHEWLFDTDFLITSFGEDESGEIYLVARQGAVYRLEKGKSD